MLAHYLPRFYLAGFTSDRVANGYEPFVHFYDLEQSRWRRRAPIKLARIPDYYAVNLDTGKLDQTIEAKLSALEGSMATILRQKLLLQQPLTLPERVRVAEFIATLFVRVPVQQALVEDQLRQIGEEQARQFYLWVSGDPSRLEQVKQHLKDTGVELSPDFGVEDLNPDAYAIEPARNATILNSFSELQTTVPHLAALGWGVSFAPEGCSFLTSDAPVLLHAHRDESDCRPFAFTDDDIEITCPLTSSVALFARANIPHLEYTEVKPSTVEQINLRTASRAETMIIASSESPTGFDNVLRMLGRDVALRDGD